MARASAADDDGRMVAQADEGAVELTADWAGVLELLPCAALVERSGVLLAANAAAVAWFGRDAVAGDVATGEVLEGGVPASDAVDDVVRWKSSVLCDGGSLRAVQCRARRLPGVQWLVLLEECEPEEREGTRLFGEVLDAAPEAMALTREGRVLHVNREFVRLFGYAAEEVCGQVLDALLLPEGRMHEEEILEHVMRSEGKASLETERLNHKRQLVPVSLLVAPLKAADASAGRFWTFRDIRTQKEQEARLHHKAMHDGLTSLPNRLLFLERLRQTTERLKRRPDRKFAVMFLDLDGFKHVNDTLGHAAGDALLLEIARRLRECIRPQDTVARFGGDEFALLLNEVHVTSELDAVAARVQASVRMPIAWGARAMRVSASIGIALVEHEGMRADDVVRDADLAMYSAKMSGKARHAFARQGAVCDDRGHVREAVQQGIGSGEGEGFSRGS